MSPVNNPDPLVSTQPVSGTVTSNIGTTNGLALDATLTGGTARTKITDGASDAAVKTASTAALAADPSLVVGLSPNSPLPTGSNTVGKVDQGTGGASAWKVDGSAVTQPVSGTLGLTNDPTKLEDAAASTGDRGTFVLAVRNDASATVTSADGDYSQISTDLAGRQKVIVEGSLPAGTNGIGKLTANDGIDIGDVTVNNASGASAVNIQDGGNSITVDGTVTSNIGTTNGLALDATLTGGTQTSRITDGTNTATVKAASTAAVAADKALVVAISPNNTVGVSGTVTANAGTGPWPVTDNGGSLTVDGAVSVNNAAGASAVNIQDGGNSITVDGTVAATQSGTWTVVASEAKAEDSVAASGDSGVPILGVRNDAATSKTSADGDYSMLATDSAGRVGIADLGGSISIDDNGSSITVDGTVASNTTPTTTGGLSVYRNIDMNATPVNIKASAGQVYGYYIANTATGSVFRYVKIYNKATAPVIGSDAALLVMTIPVPAGAAANVEFSNGIAFSSGIGITAVTGVADTNATAPTANDVIVNILYK